MLRIAGVNISEKKQVWIGLTSINGIGVSTALKICNKMGINRLIRIEDLDEKQISFIRAGT